jgi:four helix bundle protein
MALRVIGEIERVGREVNALCKQIAGHDAELASQIRRAWVRAGMNAGEAQHRRGAKGVNRFDDAMGEAREAFTGLGMARAFEYVDAAHCTRVLADVDRVVAVLYTLAHKPARAGAQSRWR